MPKRCEFISAVRNAAFLNLKWNVRYAKSAAVFASTSLPVEDLFLRFLPLNQPAALKELLMAKLEQAADEDTTEVTLLTFWLMELMLQTMDETEGEQQDLLRAELRSLLCEPKIRKSLCPIRGKVYDLLSSFGDDDTLVFFAQETGDYAVLVDHYVKKKTFVYAIAVLQQCVSFFRISLVHSLTFFL